MFPLLFGVIPMYNAVNMFGIFLSVLCAIVMILAEWRRRRKAEPPRTSYLRNYNPFRYLKKDMRRKFNPVFYILTYGIAYGSLAMGTSIAAQVTNITLVAGQLTDFGGSVAFASGVLLFIPAFLLISKLFPGNGKPTEQLEFVMPSLALNHVFNRLGCLLGGCCFGMPCHFGLVYPESALANNYYDKGTRLFPNLPLESLSMLILFIVLLVLHRKGKRTLPIFPLVFGAVGFLLGFVTSHVYEPLKPFFGFLYPTALLHLLVFFIGVVFLLMIIRENKRNRRKAQEGPAEDVLEIQETSE